MTAPALRGRVRLGSLLGASLRRDLAVGISYRLPFALDLVQRLSGVLVLFFLGRAVDGHVTALGDQGRDGYFGFVFIGMIVLGLAATSLTSYAERLRTDQATGTLEAVLAMPCPPWLALTMNAAYDLAYAAAVACASVVFAVVALDLRFHVTLGGVAIALVVFAAVVALMSAVGICFAAFCIVFKRGNALIGAVMAGLTVLGGIYYPVSLLPAPLHQVASLLPFTWGVDILRDALLTGLEPVAATLRLVVVTALVVPCSVLVFQRALDRARRQGTLGQF